VSPEMLTKIGEGHTSLLQGTDHIYWLAVRAGVVVAFQLYTSLAGSSDLLTPDGATDLVFGVTDPATRQSGVARHLLAHALGQARNRDERWCVADWRTANVEAAHAWLRSGFRPAAYRLVRTVDSRVPWAQR